MAISSIDHTSVRSWLAAAERGDFAEKANGRDTTWIGEEFPSGDFVQPGWGGYGAAGNWGRLRQLLPGSDYDYDRAAGSTWRCGAVAACLRVLKINFAQPQLEVRERVSGGETPQPILNQPLVKLCDRPNEWYDRYAFWGAFCLSAVCDGNSYAIKVRSRAKIPVELWYIPHWMMRPCWPTDGKIYISHYEYRPGNGHIYVIPREDVIHYRHGGIDPQNDRLGLADLKAGLRAVCGMNDADGYIASILRNGGVPTVTIRPVKDVGRAPTKEQADDMKRQYRERLTGENRGDPFIASGPFEVVPLGFTPEQLALDKIPARMEDQICALIGVNPMIAGLTSGAQHKTYCLPANARVWTPSGPVEISEVTPGLLVWSFVDGRLEPRPVVASGKTGNKVLYEIRTKNRTLRATGNHPILVRVAGRLGGSRVGIAWKPVEQLKVGDHIVQVKSLPEQAPAPMPNGQWPSAELMQYLGAVIGDGTVVDIKNRQRLIMAMPTGDRSGQWYREAAGKLFIKSGGDSVAIREVPRAFEFCSKPAVETLVELGFGGRAKTKRIPGWVFAQPRLHRLCFLAGLVDTDGSIDKRGLLQFALCNKDLVLDIRDLLVSVGIQCTNLHYHQFSADVLPQPGKQEFYDSWSIVASPARGIAEIPYVDPVYRERSQANADCGNTSGFDAHKTGMSSDLGFYQIKSIRELPAEDVYDIEVERGHSFIADGVVVHNSNMQEARRGLYEELIYPMQDAVATCLETHLLGDPGMGNLDTQEIGWNYKGIACLQEDQNLIWNRAGAAYQTNKIIKRSQAKEMVGLPWDKEDDVYSDGTGAIAGAEGSQPDASNNQGGVKPGGVKPGGPSTDKATQIFGYHIELGVVSDAEARKQLGLPPGDEEESARQRVLKAKIATAKAAIGIGVSLEEAIAVADLQDDIDAGNVTVKPVSAFPGKFPPGGDPNVKPNEVADGVAPGVTEPADDVSRDDEADKPKGEKTLTLPAISDEDVARALRMIEEVERRLKAG